MSLTTRQHDLLVFIDRCLREDGISPSYEEIMHAMGLRSKSGVHRLVHALRERGFISLKCDRARSMRVLRMPEDTVQARAADIVSAARLLVHWKLAEKSSDPEISARFFNTLVRSVKCYDHANGGCQDAQERASAA